MAQGTESALRGNFLLEVYPNQLVAPLISYTRGHDVQSKSVISVLPKKTSYLRVSPRLLYLYHSKHRGHSLQTRPDFTRVAGEARAPGIPPPSRTTMNLS